MKTFNPRKASIAAGINLTGTRYAGMGAVQLRAGNRDLADKWVKFLNDNQAALVKSISAKIS